MSGVKKMGICAVEGCGPQKIQAGSMCAKHYRRTRQYGDPNHLKRPPRPFGPCDVPDCGRAHVAGGFCGAHYQRVVKYGDPQADKPLVRRPTESSPAGLELFRSLYVEDDQGCWNWIGPLVPAGYGRFNYLGQAHLAHRWAYEMLIRPIPEGLVVDHLCRNRQCCRPAHLDIVDTRTNLARGMSPTFIAVRTNRCKRDHELTEDNVYRRPGNPKQRFCRECQRIRQQARRAAR